MGPRQGSAVLFQDVPVLCKGCACRTMVLMQTAPDKQLPSQHRAKQGRAHATAARLEPAAHAATHAAHTTPLQSPEDGRLLTSLPGRMERGVLVQASDARMEGIS